MKTLDIWIFIIDSVYEKAVMETVGHMESLQRTGDGGSRDE